MVCVEWWKKKNDTGMELKTEHKKNRLLPKCERSFHNTVVSLTNGLTFMLVLIVQNSKTYRDTHLEVHVISDTTVTVLYA